MEWGKKGGQLKAGKQGQSEGFTPFESVLQFIQLNFFNMKNWYDL